MGLKLKQFFVICAVVLTLTGCALVPKESGVNNGLSKLKQEVAAVQFDPAHPVKGASAEDIVRGFINAATSVAGDYQIAREFLAPNYASQWKPQESVYIDDSPRAFQTIDRNVKVSITPIATVDANGVLTTVANKSLTDLQFELEQINGDWRITKAPNGILLPKNIFTTVWEKHPLYFPGADGSLVADPRWFAVRSAMPSQIVTQLIAGPSKQIVNAVSATLSREAMLNGNGVVLRKDTITVDITTGANQMPPDSMRMIVEQFARTLFGIHGVKSINLTIDGNQFTKINTGQNDLHLSRPTVALVDNRFSGVKNESSVVLKTDTRALIEARPSSVSAQIQGDTYAALTDSGVFVFNRSGNAQLSNAVDSTPPSVDRWGNVWFAKRVGSGGKIDIATSVGSRSGYSLNLGDDPQIIGVNVAPDGARLAIFMQTQTGSEVRIYGISRRPDGSVTGVDSASVATQQFLGAPLSFDWITSESFAVLNFYKDSAQIKTGGVCDFSEERGSVQNAKLVVGTTDTGGIRVLNNKGEVYAPRGTSGWQAVGTKAALLVHWG